MVVVYVGSLLFGGVLIAASFFGAGHDADVHAGGDAGHNVDGGHDQSQASAILSLFGLRFWSFGSAFFGLTGLALYLIGGPALARDTIGQVKGASALVGREGRLLLPVARTQRGKVRMPVPGGGHIDLLAESDDDDALDAGVEVLIVEVRGNVAIVERAPAALPPGRS